MAKLGAMMVLVVHLTNYVVGKSIVGEKRKNVFETDGKYIYVIGLTVIGAIAFGSIRFFAVDFLNENVMKWFWLVFLILITGFYSFMEWKFLKDSKEYIVPLISMAVGIIFILIFMF